MVKKCGDRGYASERAEMIVKIRRGEPADAEALKAIDSVVPHDETRPESIEKWLRDDTVLVAESERKVLGYGVLNHGFFHQSQVDLLMVHADYRGRRIGEQLVRALEERCDTPKLFVTTNLSNHRMQRLLLRLGYAACGYIDELDPGDPELVFVKKMVPA